MKSACVGVFSINELKNAQWNIEKQIKFKMKMVICMWRWFVAWSYVRQSSDDKDYIQVSHSQHKNCANAPIMHGSSAFQWKTTYLRKREVNNAELRHKHLQHNWYTLTCLNRFRWMTRISGNDHSPSFFTTSCLRLQFGQCHASSAPNTSARVYNWSDKTFVCVMNMKNYWYHYTKQLKGWERHYSQEHVFF